MTFLHLPFVISVPLRALVSSPASVAPSPLPLPPCLSLSPWSVSVRVPLGHSDGLNLFPASSLPSSPSKAGPLWTHSFAHLNWGHPAGGTANGANRSAQTRGASSYVRHRVGEPFSDPLAAPLGVGLPRDCPGTWVHTHTHMHVHAVGKESVR